MAIDRIYSVSVVVGSSKCNGNCINCGGRILRQDAPQEDGLVSRNLLSACRLATRYGAWSLALTGSGEPTLSPMSITNTLKQVSEAGLTFPFTNLFTNGILLGNKEYANKWLPIWRDNGLSSVCISVHTTNHDKNAMAYGLAPNKMPLLQNIINNIKENELCPRVTLLLGKGNVDTKEQYIRELDVLYDYGVKLITSWPIVKNDGSRISNVTPSWLELTKMRLWLRLNTKAVIGHVWGGYVRAYKGMNVRFTDYVSEHKPGNDFIRQLVVFQNGEVSYSWFQPGTICLA